MPKKDVDTDGLWLRTLTFSICSQDFIERVLCRALVNTRRRFFPGLNENPTSFRWAISSYWVPGPIKRMAGCETMWGLKGILLAWQRSFIRVANWPSVWPAYAVVHCEQGMLYSTLKCWKIAKDFLYSNGRNFYSKIINGLRTTPSSVNLQENWCKRNNNNNLIITTIISIFLSQINN